MELVGTYHFTQVLRPKDDMDIYMATISGGETWDLCFEGSIEQKARPNSQHYPVICFA